MHRDGEEGVGGHKGEGEEVKINNCLRGRIRERGRMGRETNYTKKEEKKDEKYTFRSCL